MALSYRTVSALEALKGFQAYNKREAKVATIMTLLVQGRWT